MHQSAPASDRPLNGLLVVAIEQAVAAPFATRQLADLGARVIKVERPDAGDFARGYDRTVRGLSSYFVWLNRSKESLTLDIKQPQAREALARLIERADVVVQNMGPGAAERAGLDAATLRARHPRLIVCSVSGYGATGPYAARKAYDLLVQSETGVLSITGTPDAPAKVAFSVADIAAGMYAYTAVLAALLRRSQTGEGATVEVSLFDALAEWMSQPAYFTKYSGRAPARSGARHASIAPYGPVATSDGTPIFMAVQNEREWVRFCRDVLARPELLDDPRFASNSDRVRHREALEAIVEALLREWSADALVERLERAGIACARMNSVEQLLAHPQLEERRRWTTVGSPAGALEVLLPPVTMDGLEPRMDTLPALGEHTASILAELGFDPATVAEWRTRGVA
ncbi:MAG TPA: CaiB/BaiF CoA-transferase family protein [Vicinamibacterales bacterium]